MNFPVNIEQKLGFDKIKHDIQSACRSELSAREAEKINFLTNKAQVDKLLQQTQEFCHILASSENYLPVSQIDSLEWMEKIKIEGSFVGSEELNTIRIFLESAIENLLFFRDKKVKYPGLFRLVERLAVDEDLPARIYAKIDEKGEVRDNATPELRRIRGEIILLENRTRQVVQKIISKARQDGISPDDSSLTIRNGRLVIPVKAEYKRQFKGFIHDESATGQTTYIEPAEALELNNEILELRYREKREIIKILTELCGLLRADYEGIGRLYRTAAILDFIRAKAAYANKISASIPEIHSSRAVDLRKARHPVLESSLAKQGKKIVPIDITLTEKDRILVISGPNAGGKSVSLKTLGLMQYMLQCGIPIPVEEGSKTGIFQQIFIDIGDEQSMENDLSTYSSHLQHMAHFVAHANNSTLILIDEFGTGTDPKFGGAIAEAILFELVKKGAYGAISTHYSNLKKLAEKTTGLINARMRYDVAQLEPLFQLETGRPGSSFALEIARKIGLPDDLIRQARKNIGYDEVQLDSLLNELEKEKDEAMKKAEAIERKEKLLDITQKNYEELKAELENRKKEIINAAKAEALGIVAGANKKIESAIYEIKASKAQKEEIKAQKEAIVKLKEKLRPEKISKPTVKVLKGPLHIGDRVRIKGQETVGEVIRLTRKSAEVSFGAIKSKIDMAKLEKVGAAMAKVHQPTATKAVNFDVNERRSNFSSELDLRGKRVEEAYEELTRFLDHAIMFSLPTLKIIHGKGDGVLRSYVRQELRQYRQVEKIESEHADRGGDGITLVYLR